MQRGRVGDHVVGGEQPQHGVGVGFRDQGSRGGYRGGAVAADRLQQDARGGDAGGAELLGDQEAVLLIAYDDRRREALATGTKRGFLQQRAIGDERPELLGEAFARDRPEPGAGAAGEDDRDDSGCVGHLRGVCLKTGRVLHPACGAQELFSGPGPCWLHNCWLHNPRPRGLRALAAASNIPSFGWEPRCFSRSLWQRRMPRSVSPLLSSEIELGELDNGTSIGGVDLDSCRDSGGPLVEWAFSVVARLASYTETSPWPRRQGVLPVFLRRPGCAGCCGTDRRRAITQSRLRSAVHALQRRSSAGNRTASRQPLLRRHRPAIARCAASRVAR